MRPATGELSAAQPDAAPADARTADILRDRETRLELALDVAELGTWAWDLETNTGDLDARAAQIVGLLPGDLDDVVTAQLNAIHPDDLAGTLEAIQAGIASGDSFTLEYRTIHPDASVHHVLSRARVIRDVDGTHVRLLGTNRDVTEDRQRDIDNAEQLVRERRARAAAEAFLAVMSHELRTPLTTIYGTASVLRRDPKRLDVVELVEDVVEEAERLRRITDDLMVLSGVGRGALTLNPEPMLFQRALAEPIDDVRRRYPDARIEVEVPPAVPPVNADATAIRQVLYNLVSNAAKYAGRDGPITVRAALDGNGLDVAVLDHGPGPGPEPDSLFELFYRAPHTLSRASGTGIGLYVTAALLEAMGSTITASERPGGGSVFRFRLPLAAAEPEG